MLVFPETGRISIHHIQKSGSTSTVATTRVHSGVCMSLQTLLASALTVLQVPNMSFSDQQLCAVNDCKAEILYVRDRLAHASQKLCIQHRAPGGLC